MTSGLTGQRHRTSLPGFIDLQINGAFGWDFTTQPEALWEVGRLLPRYGVTAFLPTIISSTKSARLAAYAAMRSRPLDYRGAEPLGLHLEGPLLAVGKAGAHPPVAINDAVARFGEVIDEIEANADAVAMATLAPELPGAVEAIPRLVEAGIVVSLGHSEATEAAALEAADAGARAVTHVFNAMTPLHHRDVGLVGAALQDNRLTVGLIADNRHVSPSAIKLVFRLVGPYRLALVTDAIAGLGAPAGRYQVGDRVIECGDEARADTGELAGSLLDMPTAAVNFGAAVGLGLEPKGPVHPLAEVLSGTPARLLGDPHRGQLPDHSLDGHDVRWRSGEPGVFGESGMESKPGRRDLVVVDEDFRPMSTYIDGECCWRHPDVVNEA